MDFMNSYNDSANGFLAPLDRAPVAGLLKLLLVLYGGSIAAHLPDHIVKWFDFVPLKLLVLFLIVWLGNHDPALSLAIAVAFFITVNVASGKKAFEAFRSREFQDD
jgi:hypothetical protein